LPGSTYLTVGVPRWTQAVCQPNEKVLKSGPYPDFRRSVSRFTPSRRRSCQSKRPQIAGTLHERPGVARV